MRRLNLIDYVIPIVAIYFTPVTDAERMGQFLSWNYRTENSERSLDEDRRINYNEAILARRHVHLKHDVTKQRLRKHAVKLSRK